ncbi:MAG: HD domain-containing protein [Candidatus Nealsonbacteria bacterium]|nr:HD domain-containing protein [Candidatus Nealsonbacteria bacterium]
MKKKYKLILVSGSLKRIEKIEKEAQKYFKGAKGSHDWDHVERVYNLALKIGKKEKADLEILKLSAILHDIGRKHQDEVNGRIDHGETGAKLAKKILEKYNFERKKVEKIIHCVETNRFRGNKKPESKEAKILFDADKLDAIGAIGIGRAFLFAGEVGAKLHDKDVDISKTKEYTKDDSAYREYLVKLRKIKDRMFTKEGKRIARERHKFMVNFFEHLNKEVDGKL